MRRRISFAWALLGALAATGCAGGAKPNAATASKGVAGISYTVTVRLPVAGGTVESGTLSGTTFTADGNLACSVVTPANGVAPAGCTAAFSAGTPVYLRATTTQYFNGWFGDCNGTGVCQLNGNADQYVVASFSDTPEAHPTWTSGTLHGPKYFDFKRAAADALDCTLCHGASLQGQGAAPACSSCHRWPVHDGSTIQLASLTGPGATAACLKCHPQRADELLGTNHFTWLGSSDLVGHTTPGSIGKRNVINDFCVAVPSNESRCMQCHPSYGSPPVKNPATGAVAVNTGPMYLWLGNASLDKTKVDCLVCHANIGTSRYVKSPAGFGQPWVTNDGACFPSCAANQFCSKTDAAGNAWSTGLAYCRAPTSGEITTAIQGAANSVAAPRRNNCGFCHFNAGGGDNVKMGDLGSSLASPASPDVDVHMGSTASHAPKLCVDCHAAGSHAVKGTGLSIPIDNEGRFTCIDCHAGQWAPHQADGVTPHLAFMACQTCHIPTFSRQLYTKVNWDWQTAGDKQACQGLTGCVGFGTVTYPDGSTVPAVGGEAPKQSHDPVTQAYDWKKGVYTYATNVTPTYRWVAPPDQQQGTHETTARDGLLGTGTVADPYRLSDLLPPGPTPGAAGWKIAPYKKMTGRSPAFADGSAMIVPHVFGPDSLWQTDLRGYPVVPNNLGSTANPWTQAKADAIWTGLLNYGAAVGNQLGAPVAKAAGGQMTRDAANLVTVTTVADLPEPLPATLYLIGAEAAFPSGVKTVTKTGPRQFTYTETIPYTTNALASPPIPALPALPATSTQFVAFYPELKATDWNWAYTVMYINLNHEVAPPASALGCASCHVESVVPAAVGGTTATSRMKDLYGLTDGGCIDPIACTKVHP